jgi:SAM-dependent methyltransferase
MNWKIKAYLQKAVATLPEGVGYHVYFVLQCLNGTFGKIRVQPRLRVARRLVELAEQAGCSVRGKTLFELGTGWSCTTPLGLWLCGADRVITVDVNPYLKEQLVLKEVRYIVEHPNEITELFGDYSQTSMFQKRLQELCRKPPRTLQELLARSGICYWSRFDARRTSLAQGAVDFYFSWYVLQHIPPDVLRDIWRESHRILHPDGLVVHCVDAGDQFTRADPELTAIHFLQFDEDTWMRYAGNRFAYHNRLRASDYLNLARDQGFEVVLSESAVDEPSLAQLRRGFPVHPRYRGKSLEDLATIRLIFTAKKRQQFDPDSRC